MSDEQIIITSANSKAERAAFVDLGRRFSAATPHSVPQLRSEQMELVDPAKNPFFEHARVQLFIAHRAGRAVGRISAHIDELALDLPEKQGFGPGTGMFGYFDAADESVGHALLAKAEGWLRSEGMIRVLGPISMSIWEEPGLLTFGHDHPPMIMMGHHPAHYQGWIENNGYTVAKRLLTYELDITRQFPPIVQRVIAASQKSGKLTLRSADKRRSADEMRIILDILNDAWSGNWGFVPITDREIAHATKKLKPLIHPELVKIIELEGRPVAFMMTLPDINDVLSEIDGKLLPFGWLKLLKWARKPMGSGMRVPLMGVLKEFHGTRMASAMAFLLVDSIRRNADEVFHSKRGEIGWILEDNQGMIAIADMIGSTINKEYLIYEKSL
ncbi:N-acetyltransferase [Pontixanthobacter sp.]|uniref:N-acetyltransferase n=1 Tax=Pontixanthobacter sp. TaxID=2792078 RepID=UPI003C7C7B47